MTLSIFAMALKKGIPHDSHASDLYLKDCEETRALIKQYGKENVSQRFISAIDKESWWEIAFAYDPFWEKASSREKRLLSFINLVIDFTENDSAGHMQYLHQQAKNALTDFSML